MFLLLEIKTKWRPYYHWVYLTNVYRFIYNVTSLDDQPLHKEYKGLLQSLLAHNQGRNQVYGIRDHSLGIPGHKSWHGMGSGSANQMGSEWNQGSNVGSFWGSGIKI